MHFSTHLSFFPPPASHIDCKGGNKRYDKNKPFYIKTHYWTQFFPTNHQKLRIFIFTKSYFHALLFSFLTAHVPIIAVYSREVKPFSSREQAFFITSVSTFYHESKRREWESVVGKLVVWQIKTQFAAPHFRPLFVESRSSDLLKEQPSNLLGFESHNSELEWTIHQSCPAKN